MNTNTYIYVLEERLAKLSKRLEEEEEEEEKNIRVSPGLYQGFISFLCDVIIIKCAFFVLLGRSSY